MRIMVKRQGALGDVLDVTPVTRRLRREFPDAVIDVETAYPQVFKDSPNRIGLRRDIDYDRIIDLDMAFENLLRKVSAVEAYMEVAFGDRQGPFELILERGPPPDGHLDWSKVIVMHPARSWPQRTLPWFFWTSLARILGERGWTVIATGTSQDWRIPGTIDSRDQLPLHQQAAMIHAARAFVASESGPVNLAWTTDVPMVVLHTMGTPKHIVRERHGVMGWRFHPLVADIECTGCSAKLIDKPVTFFACPRGDNACVTKFDPIKVADVIEAAAA